MSKWIPLALIILGLALAFGTGRLARASNFSQTATIGIIGLLAGMLAFVCGFILLIRLLIVSI
jgi:hypothetical protein